MYHVFFVVVNFDKKEREKNEISEIPQKIPLNSEKKKIKDVNTQKPLKKPPRWVFFSE